jgi:hypothetical protein
VRSATVRAACLKAAAVCLEAVRSHPCALPLTRRLLAAAWQQRDAGGGALAHGVVVALCACLVGIARGGCWDAPSVLRVRLAVPAHGGASHTPAAFDAASDDPASSIARVGGGGGGGGGGEVDTGAEGMWGDGLAVLAWLEGVGRGAVAGAGSEAVAAAAAGARAGWAVWGL